MKSLKPNLVKHPTKQIPLSLPYITQDEISAVSRVLKSGQLSLGGKTKEFEQLVADFVGTKYAVAVSSGTSGLHLCVKAHNFQSGDEIITSPFSFVASTNVLLYENLSPVFIDIDPYTFNLDPIRIPPKYPNKRYFKGPRVGMLSCHPGGKNPGDVWDIPNVKANHVEKTIYPCQFPVELVERLVLSMTNPGDNVFDPYMGVGSAIIAALKHGRVGYGCDIEGEYVEIARDRVRQLRDGTLRTRPMGKPIYDPSQPNGGHK